MSRSKKSFTAHYEQLEESNVPALLDEAKKWRTIVVDHDTPFQTLFPTKAAEKHDKKAAIYYNLDRYTADGRMPKNLPEDEKWNKLRTA